jgi:hypothetical protein
MMQIDSIPDELKACGQWVAWEERQRDGKPTKIPINPKTGQMARANTSDTWAAFDTAYQFSRQKNCGIGFVFSIEDDLCGVDLDKCIDQTGKLEDWAEKIVAKLNSYTELSPSKRGVHVLVKGHVPPGGNRRGPVEMYDSNRYFTVTGEHMAGTPTTIEERQKELEEIHQSFIAPKQETRPKQVPVEPCSLNEQEILEKAFAAKNGNELQSLWNGDISTYDNDDSRADYALCKMLAFWTQRNPAMMDSLFRKSHLYREKWERRDYRQRTIQKAIDTCGEVYTSPLASIPSSHSAEAARLAGHLEYLAKRLYKSPNDIGSTIEKLGQIHQTWAEEKQTKKDFKFLTVEELALLPGVDWLVDGILPVGGYGVLYGKPGSGKTFVALDLALSVATGQNWHQHRVAQKQKVVYVAAEGMSGLYNRIHAWQVAHCVNDDIFNGQFWVLVEPVQLLNPEHVQTFLKSLTELGPPFGMLVIDTLARCFVGGEENSADDMGKFNAAVDQIRSQTQAHVLVIHHTAKHHDLERGSSALRGATSTMFKCTAEDQNLVLECTRQKDAEPFSEKALRLEVSPGTGSLSAQSGKMTPKFALSGKIARILFRTFRQEQAETREVLGLIDGYGKTAIYEAINFMVDNGYVTKPKLGKIQLTDDGISEFRIIRGLSG